MRMGVNGKTLGLQVGDIVIVEFGNKFREAEVLALAGEPGDTNSFALVQRTSAFVLSFPRWIREYNVEAVLKPKASKLKPGETR